VPSLPDKPNLEWLRKQAKRRLDDVRREKPEARLADAQFALAQEYGFASWRALKAHIDSLTLDGQLFAAARRGDLPALLSLIEAHPDKLHAREKPYEWTLLHAAAQNGHLAIVDELLKRGLDVNTRERGDHTYAMHWAAASGHLAVVRRLADAGGDVIGSGDDHEIEVIGWATCWPGADTANHRAVAEFLVSRGARHHIFSAIAMNLEDEVRRIVLADSSALGRRMSRFEDRRTPLQFAALMQRREMIALLLDLGADPLAVDATGLPMAFYVTIDTDRQAMEKIRAMTAADLDRGRAPASGSLGLVAFLALGDLGMADRLLRQSPDLIAPASGALHLLAHRNDAPAVKWLLARGADVNGRWVAFGGEVTPLHLAAGAGHLDMVRLLLDSGADRTIRDSRFDSTPEGWAEHFKRRDVVDFLGARLENDGA